MQPVFTRSLQPIGSLAIPMSDWLMEGCPVFIAWLIPLISLISLLRQLTASKSFTNSRLDFDASRSVLVSNLIVPSTLWENLCLVVYDFETELLFYPWTFVDWCRFVESSKSFNFSSFAYYSPKREFLHSNLLSLFWLSFALISLI